MADGTTEAAEPPAENPKYDQAFFLDLAAKGKDEWNAWRCDPANKDVQVTFQNIDFSGKVFNFSGFEFGDYANFGNVIFNGVASFSKAIFGFDAIFCSADFRGGAAFDFTTFGHVTQFTGATFGTGVTFEGAIFGASTRFNNVAFGFQSNFKRVLFRSDVSFDRSDFGAKAWFDGAVFGDRAEFSGTSWDDWKGTFSVDVANLGDWGKQLLIALEERHKGLWTLNGSGPDRLLNISFANARFYGKAILSGRLFEQTTNFTNTRFYSPPNFDSVTHASRIDFTGAHIGFVPPGKLHWTTDTQVPIRLRAFRKIAEETKNHDLERDLYIEERKAERGVYLDQRWEALKTEGLKNWPRNAARLIAHFLWVIVMGLYWALADYGRSFARPLGWLIASGFFFYWCYGRIFAPLSPKACPLVDQYDHAVRKLTLGNTVPFVGPLTIDSEIKKFLFCPLNNCSGPLIPPEGYQLLVLSQNLLSIILVFFIGLALRNYFKIK